MSASSPVSVRAVARVAKAPPPAPGFIGQGHTAVEVLDAADLVGNDPFVLLMDDRLDLPERRRIGGAHPHAGLETVTFVLEGAAHDRDEGTLEPGDVLWMSAGRGVIHNEWVESEPRARILQLWVRLPAADRDGAPRFELVRGAAAPRRREGGAEVTLYSGATWGLRSPTHNHAPVTLADVRLDPGAELALDLPADQAGFLYVLEGEVLAGSAARPVAAGEVGFLDRPSGSGASALTVRAADRSTRFVLYAGRPQREPLVHHGPFVAGSPQGIARLFHTFRSGGFERLSEVAARQRRA